MHLTPQHINYVDPQFFNPQPVTPSFRGFGRAWTLIDHASIGGGLLDSTVSGQAFDARVGSQGTAEMMLAPAGNYGNYFNTQTRSSGRVEWLETFSRRFSKGSGAHNLKLGSTITRTNSDGLFTARPINILGAAGQRLERIDFIGGTPYRLSDLEEGIFIQDHWMILPNIAIDAGSRLEYQGIISTARIAPRIGVAWTPFRERRTVIRGGFGVFYDRVPLNVFSFANYPEQVITSYGPLGQPTGAPRQFLNITLTNSAGRFPLIDSSARAGNFAPYSRTWTIELEHTVARILRMRLNYQHSDSAGNIVLTPLTIGPANALALGGSGHSSYRQLEFTAKVSGKNGQQMVFSYVRSRARGNLNEFNQYLGNFPMIPIRPDQFSNLPGDLPNRFLAWGLVNLPWKLQLAPMFEYRTGRPYAYLDAARNYVGTPYSDRTRFPNFLSLDARILKDIKASSKYTLRYSVSGFNLTNHFNALDVHANVADPQFGVFFGNYKRRYRADFEVIF